MNLENERKIVKEFVENYTYENRLGETCKYANSTKKAMLKSFNLYLSKASYKKCLADFFDDENAVEDALSSLKGKNGNAYQESSKIRRYSEIASYLKYVKHNAYEKYREKVSQYNQKTMKEKAMLKE